MTNGLIKEVLPNAKPFVMSKGNSNYTTNIFQDTKLEKNELNTLFFSKLNVNALQQGIRYSVFKQSGIKISEQSPDELHLIMRSIYLQYSTNGTDKIIQQVRTLNKKVLDYCVPTIVSEAKMHFKFKHDLTNMPEPLQHSINVSAKGGKQLPMFNYI